MIASDVIVTGAAGFVGSHLSARLVKAGYRVTGVDNLSYGNPENLSGLSGNKSFVFVERDVSRAGSLDDLDAKHLVHLASQKIPRYGNAHSTISQNSMMTSVVLNKWEHSGCRLLFSSTSDVYGKNPSVPYKETSDSVFGPVTVPRWSYAVSKLHSEHAILAQAARTGGTFAIARLFGSYGPHHHLSWWGGPQSEFISRSLMDEHLQLHGDGRQSRSFIYIDDLVNGLMGMIESPGTDNEVFNLCSVPDQEITIHDLAKLVWRLVHGDTPVKLERIPYSTFGNYEDVPRRTGSPEKAARTFGFRVETGLGEGLKKTIEWQRKAMGR